MRLNWFISICNIFFKLRCWHKSWLHLLIDSTSASITIIWRGLLKHLNFKFRNNNGTSINAATAFGVSQWSWFSFSRFDSARTNWARNGLRPMPWIIYYRFATIPGTLGKTTGINACGNSSSSSSSRSDADQTANAPGAELSARSTSSPVREGREKSKTEEKREFLFLPSIIFSVQYFYNFKQCTRISLCSVMHPYLTLSRGAAIFQSAAPLSHSAEDLEFFKVLHPYLTLPRTLKNSKSSTEWDRGAALWKNSKCCTPISLCRGKLIFLK